MVSNEASPTINLILGVHNHQPVDNWDHVMEDATVKCYQPFLDVLEAHPGVGMSVHYTGYLLDWLVNKHPELLAQLKRLVDRGQVEMVTGGYYEPVLAIIPDEDKVGQIIKLTKRVKELLGQNARGLWLAERVWEPHLVKALADAGVEYICVDDAHFKSVGLDDADLMGRYTSEEMGKTVDIFPVSQDLRYLIPYKEPQAVIDHLLKLATPCGRRAGIYFDDGEKFGVWPGTFKSVYGEKWLDRFFGLLEAHSDVIKTITMSQYVDNVPSQGRIYLPTASYSEMLEWALPAKHINLFEQALKEVPEQYNRFIRGGFWRHFMVKYPESNNLHKKMLLVANKAKAVAEKLGLADPRTVRIQDNVWQGQSNDVFWHGVFGGLYLTNLRSANYRHLLMAETEADAILKGETFFSIESKDFDCDSLPEIVIETQHQNLYLDPDEGGALFELDYRPKNVNLLDTLARRYEPYHGKLAKATIEGEGDSGEAVNIHERVVSKEKGLEKLLHYDWHRRMSLLDHFFGPETTLETLYQAKYAEQGDFVNQPYAIDQQNDQVTLTRQGTVWDGDQPRRIQVSKTLTVSKTDATTTIDYELVNLSDAPSQLWFAPEFNVNLLAPDAHDRYYYQPLTTPVVDACSIGGGTAVATECAVEKLGKLASKGELKATNGIGLIDEWQGVDIAYTFDKTASVLRFPIETISQSEAGFEKVYQSSALYPNWKLTLAPEQSWTVRITQTIKNWG
jgi:4-alpha-glucanotransferase